MKPANIAPCGITVAKLFEEYPEYMQKVKDECNSKANPLLPMMGSGTSVSQGD